MTDQLALPLRAPLEQRPAPLHRHATDTEKAAAALIEPRAGTWRAKVLFAIAASGKDGRTDWELHRELGGNLYTVAPRRNELLNDGWIQDSQRRRDTNNGTPAIVWELTDRAYRYLVGGGA